MSPTTCQMTWMSPEPLTLLSRDVGRCPADGWVVAPAGTFPGGRKRHLPDDRFASPFHGGEGSAAEAPPYFFLS